jgi:hypothetical protein
VSTYVCLQGTSVSWEGWRPVGFSTERSSATYSIDGGAPVSFDLEPPDPSDSTSRHGIWLFVAGDLAPGEHNLTVVYNGPSTPLVLDHLYVEGGSFRFEASPLQGDSASIRPSASTSSTPGPTSLPPSASSRSAPTGAIVGGVIGGLAAVALAVAMFIWLRRKSGDKMLKQTSPLTTASHAGHAGSPPSSLPPVSATHWGSADGASPSPSHVADSHGPHSPTIYRKGQEPVSVVRTEERSNATDTESHRHLDSGVRLGRRTSLPPLYTAA